MANAPDAIVLGSSPTGLYAVRELAGAGMSVGLADVSKGCTYASRHLRGSGHDFLGGLEAIEDWLMRGLPQKATKTVLVPTSDLFIEFLMDRRDLLSTRYLFAPGYRDVAADLLDKARFHRLCAGHGMPTPGVWTAGSGQELLALADTVPYPCILKPVLIHLARDYLRGRKVLVAGSRDEFVRHVQAMPVGTGGWMVQEIIPGPESEITLFGGYIGLDGHVRQAFTARKLRQYPPGFGSASLVSSTACGETLHVTEEFLRRIGFRGVCGAEYKRDPRDGVLKIIEINPRPTLWFQVSHDSGKRILQAAVHDLTGRAMPDDREQAPGVVWRYALKDWASARFYRGQRSGFPFPPPDVADADKPAMRSWPVFSADDPLPAVSEPLGFLRKAWSRAR